MCTTLSTSSTSGFGEEMRESDAERHKKNRERHEAIYDAWDYESPAGMSNQFSSELREKLRGQLQQ